MNATVTVIAGIVAAIVLSHSARADETPAVSDSGQSAVTATADGYALAPVTVTAEKQAADEQQVAISLQSFDANALADDGVRAIPQLGRVVPSLQFSMVAGFPILFIRGQGTDNFVPSADPSIATYVDGIYTPTGLGGITELTGIQRVEVLKGPQGTLYGRDATAGAINLVTANPGNRLHIQAAGELANNHDGLASLSISGPVTSWLSAGFSGGYSNREPFYSDTLFDPANDERKSARLKLRFHAENLALTLTGYHGERSGTETLIANNTNPSLLGRLAGIPQQADSYTAMNDHPAFNRSTEDIVYAMADWDLSWATVKLLGSGQRIETPYSSIDFDASPRPIAALTTTNTFAHLQTAELQFLSPEAAPGERGLSWIAGAYYLHSMTGADPGYLQISPGTLAGIFNPGTPLAGVGQSLQALFDNLGLSSTPLGTDGLAIAFRGILGTRSLSGYTQATYRFPYGVDLTLGGRVQSERRYLTKSETDLGRFDGSGTVPLQMTSLPGATSRNFTPHAVLAFHLNPQALIYGSYSVAYKSGTFNIVNIFTEPTYIRPERAQSFEIGAKLEGRDNTWRVNAALFDSEIKNLQSGFVSLFSAGAVTFVSVPKARSRGGEIETHWLVTNRRNPLVLSVSSAYVDATYTDFPSGPGFQSGTGLYSGNLDLTGHRLVYAPRWSGIVGLTQGFTVDRGLFEVGVDDYANSGYYTDANNSAREPFFAVLNARAGYSDRPTGLHAELFFRNLLGRRYHSVNVQTDFGRIKTLARPFETGLAMNWTW